MIFPTLEGLSACEQEAYEAAQRTARGCVARKQHQLIADLAERVTAAMNPSVEYSARQLMRAAGIDYCGIWRLHGAGLLNRTGRRYKYRYSRPSA